MDITKTADGDEPLIGMRVYRCHPQDGSRRAGKIRGPVLRITKLGDYEKTGNPVQPNAVAVLRTVKNDRPAGTEFVWNLKRTRGVQPTLRPDAIPKKLPDHDAFAVKKHTYVRSYRVDNDMMLRLYQRGTEYSTIMRRDLHRLYDLLDASRERLLFPPGTLDLLILAWRRAAPPPPHNQLKPSWFVPVVTEALNHLRAPEVDSLRAFMATWTPLDALAVLDAIERRPPEAVTLAAIQHAGLREEPENAPASPSEPSETQVAQGDA